MPALRKRKSRTGTPLATPTDTPPHGLELRKDKTQSSLDAWVEPAPQNPAPSFEEHGFARHGVLETMAPLGVPPSSRVKQKVRGLGDATAKRGLLGTKSNLFPGEEDGTTPEMTPAPELDRGDDSERPDDDEIIQASYVELDEDEDDDYMPTKKKQKTAHGVKTPVRGKGLTPGKSAANSKSPIKNGIRKTPTAIASPVAQPATATIQGLDQATQQRIQIAVNDAISRSNKNNRRNVGLALKELLEKSREDFKLAKSLDGVIHQKETADDWDLFRHFIKTAKKEIKLRLKMQEAEEQVRAAQEAKRAPAFTERSNTSSPSGESELAPNDSASIALDTEPAIAATTELSKAIGTASEDAMPLLRSSVGPETAATGAHPLTTAPDFPATETLAPRAPKMPSKSPRKQKAVNGHSTSTRDATAASTPADKTPESGAGSDSALSDVDEEILSAPQPPPAKVNGTSSAAVSKKAKNAALARAGKKSRANSMKPFGKHKEKPPPTAEELEQQAEIRRNRQEFDEQQQRFKDQNHMFGQAPTSDIRFDDEMLETESLTESQIAVGPPVDATRPRRAGRAPAARNNITVHTGGAKRPRDDNRFSSPRLDSATTSRPSTPAALSHVPTNKRVKLNNGQAHQSARTKKSPVKNRDGPIAGIPHTGGGGSRHFGPDDNDPGSPPSESDDLCSACKGAGEFVCCDNCPRVFHFLCCDPPRLDAPTGSFLCNECTAKLKPADDSGVESFVLLGPLFSKLESINPRAFSLPLDIRDRFEGVVARPDGSYSEDTKKVGLKKTAYGYQKPDYTKTYDDENKLISCASCGQTSGGKRQMLKCDFCPCHWHLDCLNPPMANPPHINLESSQRDAWRCPRHIEHDLRSGFVAQHDLNDAQGTSSGLDASVARLGRKVRKPKNPEIVQPTFSRGMRNNGLIEIINDPDDDTDGEGNYVFGSEEKDVSSHVYRVPEKGVVLDFISKVKSGRIAKEARNARMSKAAAEAAAQRKQSMEHFAARPIQQQQAALHLARLANRETDIGLNEQSVDALVLSLTAEAPDAVVTGISDAPPPPPTDAEIDQLMKLQQLITKRLSG